MTTGEIIRYYREMAGLTQSQLGDGICKTTHVSKIERGKIACSEDMIAMFSERLNINFQKEMAYLRELKHRLRHWHNAMIMQCATQVEALKKELEQSTIVQASKFAVRYQLLTARYHLFHKEVDKANQLLMKLDLDDADLISFDRNLRFHVLGIYYIETSKNDSFQKAIQVLNQINMMEYGNKEYYYHLSLAYYYSGSKVKAFYYIDKALRYFKETNNHVQAISAESMVLQQLSKDSHMDFDYIVQRYQSLINECEQHGYREGKGFLLNSLGYEYYDRNRFREAHPYFEKTIELAGKKSPEYLIRLFNFIDCSIEGNFSKKRFLQRKVKEGYLLAMEHHNTLHQTLFKLLEYRLGKDPEAYYQFLEEVALPHFLSGKHLTLVRRYGKLLFIYYVERKQHEKATAVSVYI
ncbi:MAG: helix-turn-helix domain-containing protein [Bacillota bacterium]